MTRWTILWTDNDGDAHVRLMEGTEKQADAVLELMRDKYEGGEGFVRGRVIGGYGFGTFKDLEDEYAEYAKEVAETGGWPA